MNNDTVKKLIDLSETKQVKISFEQRICQVAAIIVFMMTVAFYVLGFYNLPIMASYVALLAINLVMLISHLIRNGVKNFFLLKGKEQA
ncbi:MAG: hypothetical protein ACSHW0_01930 [Thalassotalea sp.]